MFPGAATVGGMLIESNLMLDPLYQGIRPVGPLAQDVVFRNNRIDRPGEDAVFVQSNAQGSGTFEANTVSNLNPGFNLLINAAPDNYQVIEAEDAWP